MNFSEEKQAEFDAFAAYYAIIAAKPYTSASRSLLNQLRSIAVGQYGNGAWQELVRNNRRQPAEQPERVVKMSGGSQRRNAPPQQGNAPQPGTPRYERLKAKGALESKLVAVEVVAGGETAEMITGKIKSIAKAISKSGKTADEISEFSERPENFVHLSTGATFDTETGRTVNDLMVDAAIKGAGEFSAKDLLEKYGDGARDLIFEKLVELGHDADVLGEKSDRQLANLLKKEAVK